MLSPGGKVCIIPFYILPTYCIRQDPTLETDLSIVDLEGADRVYVRDYNVAYGRFYSPGSFVNRIVKNAEDLTVEVVRISGLEKLNETNIYSHFALVLEKS